MNETVGFIFFQLKRMYTVVTKINCNVKFPFPLGGNSIDKMFTYFKCLRLISEYNFRRVATLIRNQIYLSPVHLKIEY